MSLIKSVRGFTPQHGASCFFAEGSIVVGDVVIGDHSSVWFNAVIRGDVNSIRIGDWVNVQDGAVIHCTFEKTKTLIGDRVSIGHNAIIHGCTIESDVLIGMGAIIMDGALIPRHCIVGAGAIVTEGKILESGWIYTGSPAKKLKPMSEEQMQFSIERTAHNYGLYASWFTPPSEDE